jgi:hypothetical protein
LPSFVVERLAPDVPPSPLRTDVAAFVGRARRGPVRSLERVIGLDAALTRYGRPTDDAHLVACLEGYFDGGGEIAHVARVASRSATVARGRLEPAAAETVTIEASSPGTWANGVETTIVASPLARAQRWTLQVRVPGEPVLVRRGETVTELEAAMVGDFPVRAPLGLGTLGATAEGTPRVLRWTAYLRDGADGDAPTTDDYLSAARRALDEPEVALVALPDLWTDLDRDDAVLVLGELTAACDALLDRMIVAELPHDANQSFEAATLARTSLRSITPRAGRALAVYHPWLIVEGGQAGTTRELPPCGHVAGLASRLDRERGPSRTPANRPMVGVVDVAGSLRGDGLAALYALHVNPITCRPGRGLQVLGGRTLSCLPAGRHIAHRRLVHRLVRSVRRVAEPLVFAPNGPDVWQALRRAATTVLLEAFRSGALHGATPTEAFSVVCDPTSHSEEDLALGRAKCEITFAPADPVEWIRIFVVTTPEGALEVVEA